MNGSPEKGIQPQMKAEERRYKHEQLTEAIIGVFYQVYYEPGAQLLNYLRATEIEVGLLLNSGPRPQVRRFAFANERKGISVHLRSSAAKGVS